jgi:hypothetical protein
MIGRLRGLSDCSVEAGSVCENLRFRMSCTGEIENLFQIYLRIKRTMFDLTRPTGRSSSFDF